MKIIYFGYVLKTRLNSLSNKSERTVMGDILTNEDFKVIFESL